MANVIKHKRGSGSDPSASDLILGELAIRTDTGKLFTKMDSGAIAEIAGGGSDIAINTLSASSGSGGNNSGVFDDSATRFTLSSPPNVSAAQLLVSVNGVIQKPVLGTGTPSEGFSVDGNDIIFSSPPETGADFFILTFRSLGVSEPADNSVTSAKIVDGAIVNADINASAAIAGTKISPNFGSQNTTTTGIAAVGELQITSTAPKILFIDSDTDPDYELRNMNGVFRLRDSTNDIIRITQTGSITDIAGHVDVGAGLDVTGGITASNTGNASLILDAGTGSQAGNQVSFIDFKLDGTLKANIAVNEGGFHAGDLEINSAGTGATKLFNAGSKKLSTTGTGINVYGSGSTFLELGSEAGATDSVFIDTSHGSNAKPNMDFKLDGDLVLRITPNEHLDFNKSVYGEQDSEDFYRIKFNDVGGTGNDVGIGQPDSSSIGFNTVSNGSIRFYQGTDGEVMRIHTNQFLGVGTASPIRQLHVKATNSSVARFESTHATIAQISFASLDSATDVFIGATADTNFFVNTGNTQRLVIDNSGVTQMAVGSSVLFSRNTGGTNTTAVQFKTAGSQVGKIFFNNTDTFYSTGSSDRTLKKNFENWTETILTSFKNLNPQKFNFLQEENTDPKHKGFIAQDLADKFPEAYPIDPEIDKYGFNPSGMVVYLMKAVQELTAKVEALEAK